MIYYNYHTGGNKMEYCSIEEAKEIVAVKYENALTQLGLHGRFDMPKIVWRPMGVRRAGCCNYSENKIELNSDYLKSKDWKAFLDDTPLHELAHAISWQLYDETGHKGAWKKISLMIGLAGNRCHNFSRPEGVKVTTRTRKRYTVRCACSEHIITSVKYNRMLKGTVYICSKCREKVTF
jgi:SprT protein